MLIAIAASQKRSRGASDALPYTLKRGLFSPAERSFLGVLEQAIGEHYQIFGKVRLADVIATKRGLSSSNWQSASSRINAKHFDFLLCNKDDLTFVCAIELDDKSHQKDSRRQRDAFVVELCRSVGLPLMRFTAKRMYSVQELRTNILDATQQRLERGELTRGMPTAHAAPPVKRHLRSTDEPPPVWPHPDGQTKGIAFSPLYKLAPNAAKADSQLYELLVIVDAIRGGRAREHAIGIKELKQRLERCGERAAESQP